MSSINAVANISVGQGKALRQPDGVGGGASKADGFENTIKGMLDKTDAQIKTADKLAEAYVKGEDVPIHNVMLELSRAEMAMRLTSAVSSKVIQAYQEISRMQL
jgi:flagellar hook-basal body complex protein FliE